MLGNPDFEYKDRVKFKVEGQTVVGEVAIIDAHGIFADSSQCYYDVMGDDNIFYKHIPEDMLYYEAEAL